MNKEVGIKVYRSTQLERLFKQLLEHIQTPLAHPFDAEKIVIQTPGVQEWLRLHIMREYGICAQVHFPFMRVLVWQIFQRALTGVPDQPSLNPEAMSWALLELLPQCVDKPGFEAVNAYLAGDDHGQKRLQLAQKIAYLFDRYSIYRPDIVLGWDAGQDAGDWQAELWRALVKTLGPHHRARLQARFLQALQQGRIKSSALPERLNIFGLSFMPPFYYEVFQALSAYLPIHFYLLSSRSERGDQAVTLSMLKASEAWIADFETQLPAPVDLVPQAPAQAESLLQQVQQSLFQGAASEQKSTLDSSLQIHAVHSIRRELEVLKDYLIRQLNEIPELKPEDILVMAPHIEPYEALIEAVFSEGQKGENGVHLPFRIVERSAVQESPVYKAFDDILALLESRIGLPQLLAVLEQEVVHKAFDIQAEELAQCQTWLQAVQVRWGMDAAHRKKFALPAYRENSFEQGLSRLLLGYALPTQGQVLVHQLLPYDEIEGNAAQLLGKLVDFCEQIFDLARRCQQKLVLSEWGELLNHIPEYFIQAGFQDESDLNGIDRLLRALAELEKHFDEAVSLSWVRKHLSSQLQRNNRFMGLTGHIAFGSNLALRAIPAKVICLIGQNIGHPKAPETVDFDIRQRESRPCDDSPKLHDRYMFLENIMSAREALYISYQGRSLKDNSKIPPSVLVSELIDVLEDITETTEPISEHPLHPFSPQEFKGPHPSYNARAHQIMQGIYQQERTAFSRFRQGRSLSLPNQLTLKELSTFLIHPPKYYLQQRLGIFFPKVNEQALDHENFELSALERYQLDQELCEHLIEDSELADFLQLKIAEQILPVGAVGVHVFEKQADTAKQFVSALRGYLESPLPEVPFELQLGEQQLQGRLKNLYGAGRIFWRLGRLRPKDKLEAWLHHLCLCLLPDPPTEQRTTLIGFAKQKIESCEYEFETQAAEILAQYIHLYREGLTRPLPIFPEASYTWAEKHEKLSREELVETIQKDWINTNFKPPIGEGTDLYTLRCFDDKDYFNQDFQTLSEQVFESLFTHMRQSA